MVQHQSVLQCADPIYFVCMCMKQKKLVLFSHRDVAYNYCVCNINNILFSFESIKEPEDGQGRWTKTCDTCILYLTGININFRFSEIPPLPNNFFQIDVLDVCMSVKHIIESMRFGKNFIRTKTKTKQTNKNKTGTRMFRYL